MTTATPLMTHTKDDVVQTTYELSELVSYTRWTGERRKTKYIIVSHSRQLGANETAIFPGTVDGEILSYADLYMRHPMTDNVSALTAIGLTPTPPPAPERV